MSNIYDLILSSPRSDLDVLETPPSPRQQKLHDFILRCKLHWELRTLKKIEIYQSSVHARTWSVPADACRVYDAKRLAAAVNIIDIPHHLHKGRSV